MKSKFTLEFDMKGTPPPLLWKYISSPQGMAQWFSDDVTQQGSRLTFHWHGGGESDAEILAIRSLIYIRLKWVDDDFDKSYFEMKIVSSELTQVTTLLVTDWADDDDDKHSITELWEHQIDILRRIIGCK
ncbi:MAG: hypothetical protein J1F10_07360 [Muribaculaceae bacterium]|nr:hypothetical protein [Muribaculaceae bacterium]